MLSFTEHCEHNQICSHTRVCRMVLFLINYFQSHVLHEQNSRQLFLILLMNFNFLIFGYVNGSHIAIFTFPQVEYSIGGIFRRGNFPQVEFSIDGIFRRGNVPQVEFSVGGMFHRWNFPQGKFSLGGIFRKGNVPQVEFTGHGILASLLFFLSSHHYCSFYPCIIRSMTISSM